MNFDKAEMVDSVCYQIRLADFPRGQNRARINNLFNGVPPFDEAQAEANGININVNFLEGTVLSHDARAQFYGAFMKPGQYFTAATDMGDKNKRSLNGQIVTAEMNKVMKRSMTYFETFRSKFAMDVLHGIGPSTWRDQDKWCPDATGIEDLGIPGNTLLTMENMPFFYIYHSYTAPELLKLTQDRRKASRSGWNLPVVDSAVKYIDQMSQQLMGSNWPEVWSPEKTQERVKGDGGFYAGDQVPTIDCFDFYFYHDDGKSSGWRRRIILDAWSTPSMSGGVVTSSRVPDKNFSRNQFLFTSGDRNVAANLSEMVSFQFADLSAVAPFRYHSVRSLGFLVYAVCHLQNRMRCRFNESVFEALMNYYRVRSSDEAERALKLDLINRGFIDETIQFVPQSERWEVNEGLIGMGLAHNKNIIDSNASSYTQGQVDNSPGQRKTKFQVMAEINQTTALVQAAFNQAYQYQEGEYREIFRRFCRPNSDDPQVRDFRARVAAKGVPITLLCPEYWELSPSKVMGAGNKTMEMTIAQQLLEMRQLFDPEPQREVFREIVFNVTGDSDKAQRWVPDQPLKVSDSVHDAQVSMGTLMMGLPIAVKTGQNHKEYIMVFLGELEMLINATEKSGGMATQDKIMGFQNVAQTINAHLQILSQDEEEKEFVAKAQKQLAKLMNMVRAFVQRLQEQMKKQQQAQGGDPETGAKIKATLITAKAKADNARESHGQRTAQKQLSWRMEEQRKQQAFELEQQRKNHEAVIDSKLKSIKKRNGNGDGE